MTNDLSRSQAAADYVSVGVRGITIAAMSKGVVQMKALGMEGSMHKMLALALLALALLGGVAAFTTIQTRPAIADPNGCNGSNC